MTSFHLKLIGIVSMLIDHVGVIFFPQYKIFNIIGRLAFPIFTFFIAEGYRRTRNPNMYILRLLLIAIVSQVPFVITFRKAFGEQFFGLNTIFDLLMGLIAIYIYDRSEWKGRQLFIWIFAILSFILKIDGNVIGVFMIYFFYKYHGDFKKISSRIIMLYVLDGLLFILYILAMGMPFNMIFSPEGRNLLINIGIQIFSILALIPIKIYNGEKGHNLKYLFYVFYPAHLLLIYLFTFLVY